MRRRVVSRQPIVGAHQRGVRPTPPSMAEKSGVHDHAGDEQDVPRWTGEIRVFSADNEGWPGPLSRSHPDPPMRTRTKPTALWRPRSGTTWRQSETPRPRWFSLVTRRVDRRTEMDQPPPISVKGVLIERGAVLLLENKRSEWELPGGRLERGETPQACLAREFHEETGAVVQVGRILDAWVFEVIPGRFVFIVTYAVSRAGAEPLAHGPEHKRMRWWPLDELTGAPLPDGYRRSIEACASLTADQPKASDSDVSDDRD
jgi:ADP-ribose pyrophosphatase YjhB (NUDIX family)